MSFRRTVIDGTIQADLAQLKWFLCDHREWRKTGFVICDGQTHAAASPLGGKKRIEDPARMEIPCRVASRNPGGGFFHSERFEGRGLRQRSTSGPQLSSEKIGMLCGCGPWCISHCVCCENNPVDLAKAG
jgi:hypothetical protein